MTEAILKIDQRVKRFGSQTELSEISADELIKQRIGFVPQRDELLDSMCGGEWSAHCCRILH